MSTPRLISTLKQYQRIGSRWQFIFPKTPKQRGLCKVIFCRRVARVRVRNAKRKFLIEQCPVCPTCECRLYRANNPARDAYRQIKDRAQRRNQVFKLSFNEFLNVIEGTGYLEKRGRGLEELHLDRKQVELGYVPGNLAVITTEENLRKQREVDYCYQVEEPF